MSNGAPPISLAGSHLGDTRHVCAFFASDDEEYRVLLPFIREGFDRGDKAIHVLNPGQHEDHVRRLAAAGIDTGAAAERGQLELRTSTDMYLQDGCFDAELMLGAFERLASDSVREGFPISRIVCRMDWAAGGHSFIDDVMEFESRVNELWRHRGDAVICTYRLDRFGADAVIPIMRTHPMVIVGGILQRNPFFVPPEQLVPEFRASRASRGIEQPPAV
jgi:hypothetical protein